MLKLKNRDEEILSFIAMFGYVQEIHVAKLCNLSHVQARRILKRLEDSEYVILHKVLASNGNYVTLSRKGGALLDIKVVNAPVLNTLNHDTLLVDLYFLLVNQAAVDGNMVKTDKHIRKDFGIFKSNSQQRVPDLLIDDTIAIELEISEKPKSRLQEIINTYIVDDSIQLVCYFLKSLALMNKIHSLTHNSPKFKFVLFDLEAGNKFVNLRYKTTQGLIELANISSLFVLPVNQIKRFGNYEF